MRRSLIWSLLVIVVAAFGSLAATLAVGNKPLLGLDLRGGLSVVLTPTHKTSSANLDQAVSIIDRRVNGLGVANSSVTRQGNDVVVSLPGIKHAQNALSVVGQTAELFFRPVYCEIPTYSAPAKAKSPAATSPQGLGAPPSAALTAAVVRATGTTPGSATATTTPPAAGSGTATPTTVSPSSPPSQADCGASNAANLPSTSAGKDVANATVILPSYDHTVRYVLGPADLHGNVVKNATVVAPTSGGGYEVQVNFTGAGGKAFDRIAAVRYASYKTNPSNPPYSSLEAIDLDGQVESAPTIQAASFNGVAVISGASSNPFTITQANNLALVLRYGALPVSFARQSVQTVSATIGKDSLRAGLLAGLGGIVAVLLYMIVYYRALGLVVVVGLGVGGSMLYAILTELGQTSNLTLTLSGITGIIVSVGITVDSYVVYFERLKDEVRGGRSIRASVERSFARAFRTVLTADFVSFLAALILYLLTIGDVKGFAFTLGLSTLLDVVTAYFFIRPAVILAGRRRAFIDARFLGIGRGLGATPTSTPAPAVAAGKGRP